MAFEVLITDEAFADLDTITGFLKRQGSIDIARKWFGAIIGAIGTLKEMPGRCPLAPEAEELPWLKERAHSDADNDVRIAAVRELARGWKDDAEVIEILRQAEPN